MSASSQPCPAPTSAACPVLLPVLSSLQEGSGTYIPGVWVCLCGCVCVQHPGWDMGPRGPCAQVTVAGQQLPGSGRAQQPKGPTSYTHVYIPWHKFTSTCWRGEQDEAIGAVWVCMSAGCIHHGWWGTHAPAGVPRSAQPPAGRRVPQQGRQRLAGAGCRQGAGQSTRPVTPCLVPPHSPRMVQQHQLGTCSSHAARPKAPSSPTECSKGKQPSLAQRSHHAHPSASSRGSWEMC